MRIRGLFVVFQAVLLGTACSGDGDENPAAAGTELEETIQPTNCATGSGQACSSTRVAAICPNTYGPTPDGCANQMLPPLPSVTRPMSFLGHDLLTGTLSKKVRHFPSNIGCTDNPTGACEQVLPFYQTTRDGRLGVTTQYNSAQTRIFAFRPENLGYDFRALGGVRSTDDSNPPETFQPTLNQPTPTSNVPYDRQSSSSDLDILLWHNPTDSTLGRMSFKKDGTGFHLDGPHALSQVLCETSTAATTMPSGRSRNPYRCRARWGEGDQDTEGVCYDVTHILGTQQPFDAPFGWGPRQVELVSVDLTIFTAKANSSHLGDKLSSNLTDARAQAGVWLYPRSPRGTALQIIGFEKIPVLPAYQPYLKSLDDAKTRLEEVMNVQLPAHGVAYPVGTDPAKITTADTTMKSVLEAFMTDSAQGCYTSSAPGAAFKTDMPRYCEYWKNRRHRNEFYADRDGNDVVGSISAPNTLMHWNGLETGEDANGHPERNNNGPNSTAKSFGTRIEFAEMSNTADGRLLVFNAISGGLHYAAMSQACRIDTLDVIRPLSQFPFDPAVAHYPLAQYQKLANGTVKPFADTDGTPFNPGQDINAGYPWVDREGRNVFFSTLPGDRDNWFAMNLGTGISRLPSRTQPKIGMVLGAWTQGKARILDDGSNLADWAPGPGLKVQMSLYSTRNANHEVTGAQAIWSQIKQIQQFSSTENEWFHLDAHRPRLPMDVVWNVGTDSQRNLEVAFDDWLDRRAVIVAPMIAMSKVRPYDVFQQDGFVRQNFADAPLKDPADPTKGTCSGSAHYGDGNWSDWAYAKSKCAGPADPPDKFAPQFTFSQTPLLVNNAATNDQNKATPAALELRGGARVEPISLGGVRGKGVYLDGFNDYIASKEFPSYSANSTASHWLASAFFDSRALTDDSTERVLFAFGDGSYIALRHQLNTASEAHGDGTASGPDGAEGPVVLGPHYDVVLFHGPSKTVKTINIGNSVTSKRYFHFSALVTGRAMMQIKSRTVKVFINGTAIGSQTFDAPLTKTAGFDIRKDNGQSQFFVGDPGPTFAPSRTKRSFKGWVDDLRLFMIDGSDTGEGYLPETICNHALGTLVDIGKKAGETAKPAIERLRAAYQTRFASRQAIPAVLPYCEQMRLDSHTSSTDLGPQRTSIGNPRACIDYVHTNPNEDGELAARCLHKGTLQLPNLTWNEARPNSSNTNFCRTCHQDGTTSLPALALSALTSHPENLAMWKDPRRQPLQPPAYLAGAYGGADTADGSRPHEVFYKRVFLLSTTAASRSTDASLADTGGYARPWYMP